MNNRNNLALFGLIAFFVVGLGLTAYFVLGSASGGKAGGQGDGQPTPAPPKRSVFVARKDIAPRTIITEDLVEESSSATVKPNLVGTKEELIGRMAAMTIYKGEELTTEMTLKPLRRVVLANIPVQQQTLRAVAIWVDPLQTAAGLIDQGDRVDVIAAHKLKYRNPAGGDGELVSGRTIAQNLEVLAVDESIKKQAQPTPAPARPGAAPGAPAPAPTTPPPPPAPGQKVFTRVVLAATPEIAEQLVAANLSGELHLTIRNPVAQDNYKTVGAKEYPVQIVDPLAYRRREAQVQADITDLNAKRSLANELASMKARDAVNRASKPAIPSFTTSPWPPNPTAVATPVVPVATAAPAREITVVRGTEKTRVAIPAN